jgi:hypothetical protein
MSVYQIDIASLLAMTFASNINLYAINPETLKKAQDKKYDVGYYPYSAADVEGEGSNGQIKTGNNGLGLPILQNISFTSTDPNTPKYNMGDALVTFTSTRRNVRTPMQGQDEDVIEFISNGNWNVKIQGFLVSPNPYRAPLDAIRLFKTWFRDKKESLGVVGKMFDSLGIHQLVIESANLSAIPGMINVRPFELSCISDLDYSLQIMQNS